MKYSIIVLLCCFFFFNACDEIMPVIPEPPEPGEHVVLMEEFSGGKCVPCADAAVIIKEISTQFGENFVPVTIHTFTGGQADPYPGAKYDFRTEDGQKLIEFLGLPLGIPSGVVDRKLFPGEETLQTFKSKWSGLVQEALNSTAGASLNIQVDYDDASREMKIDVTTVTQQEISGDLRLIVMVVESKLIDKQAVPTGDGVDPNFEHNHILRDVITPVTGELLGTAVPAQTAFTNSIDFVIPLDDLDWWIPANMEVVAFVVNNEGESKEVLQAHAVHFAE